MMKKYLLTLIVLLLVVHSASAGEQFENSGNLRELIVLGLKSNLGLQVELFNVQQALDAITIEEALFDSQLFAGTQYSKSSLPYASTFTSASTSDTEKISGKIGLTKRYHTGLSATLALDSEWLDTNDSTSRLDPSYRTAVVVDLNQPLLRNLGTAVNTTNISVSRNQRRQEALKFLLQVQQLSLQLEVTARQLATKTAIVALRKEALELAEELLAANRKRFATGVIAVTQVQEAETSVAARQLNLSQAVQERDLLWENLNRLVNQRLSDQFTATALIPPAAAVTAPSLQTMQELLNVARQKRLELKINDFSLHSRTLQRDFLANQLKPQLDLNVQAGINGLSGNEHFSTVNSQYAGDWGDSFSSLAQVEGFQWQIGLNFSLPIGNRAAKSRLHQADLLLRQERYRRHDIEAAIMDDLRQQRINVTQAWRQLKIAAEFEELAKRSLSQEQRRLEEGLSDTFRIIVYQNTMVSAKIDRVNALTNYQLALARFDFASGKIFERHNIILAKDLKELSLENI